MGTRGAIGYINGGEKVPFQFFTNTDFYYHLERAIAHIENPANVYLDSGMTNLIQDPESEALSIVYGHQCRAIIDIDKHTVQTEDMSMPLTFKEYETFDEDLPQVIPTLLELAKGEYESYISDI